MHWLLRRLAEGKSTSVLVVGHAQSTGLAEGATCILVALVRGITSAPVQRGRCMEYVLPIFKRLGPSFKCTPAGL